MADPVLSLREFNLLKKEVEILGDEIERLRVEMETIRPPRAPAVAWHPLRSVPQSERRALHFTPPQIDALDEAAARENDAKASLRRVSGE